MGKKKGVMGFDGRDENSNYAVNENQQIMSNPTKLSRLSSS